MLLSGRHCGLATAIAMAALALVLAAPAAAQAEPGLTVTGAQTVEHRAFTVEGTITVESGGSLTLDTVELAIAPSPDQAPALIVKPGGTLTVRHSTIAAYSEPLRVELAGTVAISDSTFRGLAADATRGAGAALSSGFRIAAGGLLITSDAVALEGVSVEGSEGCAVTVSSASPSLRGLHLADIGYRNVGSEAFAAGVCLEGGSATVDGLSVAGIGSRASGAPGALWSAALVADSPQRLVLRNLDARGFAPVLAGHPEPRSAAVVVESPGSMLVSGGRIENVTDGIVVRGPGTPVAGGSLTLEALAIVNVASGPVSYIQAYSSDPNLLISGLDITGCGGNGVYVESQNSGVNTAVTVTVSNVTARGCGAVGINLYDNNAVGAHTFNVWSSNASSNGQEGFFLHGSNMGAGLNVLMADNGAWKNNYAGIRVNAVYNSGGAAKIASGKFERNTADNNTGVNNGLDSGGIFLQFGSPATLSFRYLYNTARGNGVSSGFASYYGHYMEVRASNSINIGTGWITGLVAQNNTHYGLGFVGGGGGIRLDGIRINDSRVTGQPTGVYGENARIEIWNSTMSNTNELEGLLTGFYLMGTVHNRLTGTTTGLLKIISYKQICMHGVWQNGGPLYLLPLTFSSGTNNSAAPVYGDVSVDPPTAAPTKQTDMNGNWSGWVLDWTFDPQGAPNPRTDYAPLTISVQQYQTIAKSPPFDLNTNICGTIQYTDPNPPDIIMSSPVQAGYFTQSYITLRGSVTDDLSGVAGVQVKIEGGGWVDVPGPYTPFTYTFSNLSDGEYTVYVKAWDRANAGLVLDWYEVSLSGIIIDTTKPTLSLTVPPLQDGDDYWTSSSQIFFQGRVDENTSELYVNGQPIQINGTTFLYIGDLPNEGPQSFLFLAVDRAGNTQNLTVTIFKDTVLPTLIVTAPVGRGEIFVNSHDLLVSGITDANAQVTVNGVATAVTNATFSTHVTLAEGRNLVNLSAVDAAGNPTTRTLVVTADTIAPVISIASPPEGAYLNSSRLELDGSISEAVAYLEINLRIFAVTSLDFQAIMGLAEGDNLISINATDRAGNIGRATRQLTVDTHAPLITLFGLQDYTTRNLRQLTLHGAVSEQAVVLINGVPADVVALEFNADLQLTEGLNTITVTATDLAGNRATEVRHVTLDTQDPTIQILEPKAGTQVHSRVIRLAGTVEPNATVSVGGQLIQADASGHFVAWITLESDGANLVNVTVEDAAGNRVSNVYTVTYAAAVQDTSGDLYVGIAGMVGIAAGLGVAGHLLVKRRVGAEVERARAARAAQQAQEAGTPGYTEGNGQTQVYEAPYGYAPPSPEGDPNAGYAQAPAVADPSYGYAQSEGAGDPASQPPPPRPPRPPRPPSS